MNKIYILLPVHNRLEQTRLFVDSLLAQTYQNYHLVLIDDGSTDGTAEYVKSRVPALTVLTGKGDWWWGGGLHQGYLWLKRNKVSADDLVLMINNDTEFGPDFLRTAGALLLGPDKVLLQATVYSRQTRRMLDPGLRMDFRRMTFEPALEDSEINCVSTRALFMRVRDFFDIGGFHPVLLKHYLSDCEWTIRAHRKGYRLIVDSSLEVRVDETTTGYSACSDIHGVRNVLEQIFSKRNVSNPCDWFFFVIFVIPWPWKGVNLLRVIYGGMKSLFKGLFCRDKQ